MSINWNSKKGYFGNGIQTDLISAITSAGVEIEQNLEVANDLTVNNDVIVLGTSNFGDDVSVDTGVTLFVDTLSEQTLNNGVQVVGGVKFHTNEIVETTTNAGVKIEGLKIEDGTIDWTDTYVTNQTDFPGGYKYEQWSSTTTAGGGTGTPAGATCTIYFVRLGEMVFVDVRYTHNAVSGTYVDLDTALPSYFRPVISYANRVGMVSASASANWVYSTVNDFGIMRIGMVNSGFSLISLGSTTLSFQTQWRCTASW